MNILLGDKRGFALQVTVDVIHCHHTGLVNNPNITVHPGFLYVPDLQLPHLLQAQTAGYQHRLNNTDASTKKKKKNPCKITLSTEWNWKRTIPSRLNGVSERNR